MAEGATSFKAEAPEEASEEEEEAEEEDERKSDERRGTTRLDSVLARGRWVRVWLDGVAAENVGSRMR